MSVTRFLAVVVSAIAVTLGAGTVCGQQLQPNKPIRIVTSGVGGGTDIVARLLAAGLTANLGQHVLVENRGSSVVPGDIVAKALPDGHTLLISTGGIVWVMSFFQPVPYDPVKDFAPVSLTATFPAVLAVNGSLPVTSTKEFIALAKAKPGSLNYVMTAVGGSAHLAAELLNHMAGVKIVPVAYKNAGDGITDLISGRVQMFLSAAGAVMPHVKSGRLKALAVTSAKPSALVPDVPTVAAVVPGYEMEAVYCMFAPAKTPAAIINKLNQEVVKLLNQPDTKSKFLAIGIEPAHSTPAELGALRQTDIVRMGKLIKDAGISTK
jgi:tripartite-type tricarboxylate transporter receptor subunit TctC